MSINSPTSVRLIELLLRHATTIPSDLFDHIASYPAKDRRDWTLPALARADTPDALRAALTEDALTPDGSRAIHAEQLGAAELARQCAQRTDLADCLQETRPTFAAGSFHEPLRLARFTNAVYDLTQPGHPARAALLESDDLAILSKVADTALVSNQPDDALAAILRIDPMVAEAERRRALSSGDDAKVTGLIKTFMRVHADLSAPLLKLSSATMLLAALVGLGSLRLPQEDADHALTLLVPDDQPRSLGALHSSDVPDLVESASVEEATRALRALDEWAPYLGERSTAVSALRRCLLTKVHDAAGEPAFGAEPLTELLAHQGDATSSADWIIDSMAGPGSRWAALSQIADRRTSKDLPVRDLVELSSAVVA